MLKLDRVSKSFQTGAFGGGGAFPAVRKVSFEILPGEVTALIGESGSGKSTLGKMILKLESITSGTITFEGQDIAQVKGQALKEYYRHVQGVFQDPFSSYNPVFRADRVFAMVRDAYFPHVTREAWDEKIESSLEAVGMNPADVLNRFTHQLSGGQLQRLLIARALLLDLKLLIADEIISMLDASTRVDVLNLLASLKRQGLGILFITHDLSLGNYISERAVILRRGIVLEMGATEKVFTNPRHPYTKMLLASVPQLHKKWESLDEVTRLSEMASAVAAERRAEAASAGAGAPERRHLAGPHLLHRQQLERRQQVDRAAPEVGAELFRRRGDDSYLRAHEEVGELVEVEPDHLMAVGSSAE